MNLRSIVWKEIRERPLSMLTSAVIIVLGVAALVAIRHVTLASEQDVKSQLASLGANVLILPQGADLQDYYAADENGKTLPEENAAKILLESLPGVEELSPKLCVQAAIDKQPVSLVGILPQSEFEAQSAWQSVGMFTKTKHVGCTKANGGADKSDLPEALATARTVQVLGKDEAIVGADVAERHELMAGQWLFLLGERFKLIAILPRTGTVDDSRVFAHLHAVQRLANTGEVVSAIEVMACCEEAAGDLVSQLAALLPDCKVVTISQVVATQVNVNRMMRGVSWFALAVLVVVGGASVAGTIAANARERRREVGTLMALGATPGLVARLFLAKALLLGLGGGIVGAVVGLVTAVVLGPVWAGTPVAPLPSLLAIAVGASVGVCMLSAYLPSRRAAKLDPCCCFQEV
jgi:putative ABC transport system permease protein